MNLRKKKELAARALKVGKDRIVFVKERFDEIKESITKQDIKDLKEEGAIRVKNINGRRKVVKRKRSRGPGKIKKKVNKRKQEYVKATRKQRKHIKDLKEKGLISREEFKEIRKKIRNRDFKSHAHLKIHTLGGKKWKF